MDTSAPDITFAQGICNYCREFIAGSGHVLTRDAAARKEDLDTFVASVKSAGKGKPYDCVIGVSGGVDSSWALVQAVRLGLRPLAVHMDNGWNSELGQNNIANLVRGLGVDLFTHVINWEEYRAFMQSFFDADVIDVELLYDNAMRAVNYSQASRNGVRFILSGSNTSTEGMRMPAGWNWNKLDRRNIKALGKRFGGARLDTFPSIGTLGIAWSTIVRRIRWVSFLDLFEYNKFEAIEELQKMYGYKPYPYKHYESIFTRFYQGYILPEKFGVDKRRVHLSALVVSGQLTREEALEGLKGIAYSSPSQLEEDKDYFLKKMGWSREDLAAYISRPPKSHLEYPSERPLLDFLSAMRGRFAKNG